MICIAVILVSFTISDECLKKYETFGNKVKAEEDFHLKIYILCFVRLFFKQMFYAVILRRENSSPWDAGNV